MGNSNLNKSKILGIVNIQPKERTEEEIAKILKEKYEDFFNPFYETGGRFGNIRIPFDDFPNIEESPQNPNISEE